MLPDLQTATTIGCRSVSVVGSIVVSATGLLPVYPDPPCTGITDPSVGPSFWQLTQRRFPVSMVPQTNREGPDILVPIAFVVDSSLVVGTSWPRAFTEYVSPLVTRLHDVYAGQGAVRFFAIVQVLTTDPNKPRWPGSTWIRVLRTPNYTA